MRRPQAIRGAAAIVAALTVVTAASPVLALGSDYEKPPAVAPDSWSPALHELVRGEHWVHGYFVNAEDKHFYAGDTDALNRFLKAYAKLGETKLEVVVHAGRKNAVSPWNESGVGPQANWALYVAPRDWLIPGGKLDASDPPTITRVDLWIGDAIDIDDLRIPVSGGMTVRIGKDVRINGALRVEQNGAPGESSGSQRKADGRRDRKLVRGFPAASEAVCPSTA